MNKTIFDIVKEGTLEELIQAIKENVDVNEKNIYGSSLLHIACLNNELEKVKILFKAGADVYLEDKSRQSSFGIALKKKHFEIVKFFLKNGTHIDSTKPFNGFTSVFFAAFFEHDIEMCEELLKMEPIQILNVLMDS